MEPPAFKIKTGTLPVLQLHILTTDMAQLKEQLALRLKLTPDFFASTPIALELSAIAEYGAGLNYAELAAFMLEHGMCAAGVVGGSAGQRAAAVQAGLGLFTEAPARNAPKRDAEHVITASPAAELHEQPELPGFSAVESEKQPAAPLPVQAAAEMPPPVRATMVIDRPVRTGQRIYAEGGNLVVLAIVNAGAELIADGDIHVYAPMRGKAIAGAQGNAAARIFVQGMEAELLSIAGCFKVFEDGIPENVRGKPAQVHLEGSRLHIQPLTH
ncbi:MAG: septum site-determining protein MinC [Gallionella sp.]|nr:septum site-determining protein MinC [Gallionella sp.]